MTHGAPLPPLIDALSLGAGLGDPRWRVFDCRFDLADPARGERDFAAGHVPGASYAHLERNLSGPVTPHGGRHSLPEPRTLARWLAANGVAEDSRVVVYDDTAGSMAARLWWLLRWLGHPAVAVLDGGWRAWLAAGLHVSTADASPPPGRVPARARPHMVLTTEQLLAAGVSARWVLLDARTGPRYRGEEEPIDPVAGHIPGSLSHPLQLNLAEDGRFLPPGELRRRYLGRIGDTAPARVACLCGSGVTACHNLLAMEIAGLPGARLYAGSWSEWIRDPRRPVAVGPRP